MTDQPTVELVTTGETTGDMDLMSIGRFEVNDSLYMWLVRINGQDMGYVPGPLIVERGPGGVATMTVTLMPSTVTLRTVAADGKETTS